MTFRLGLALLPLVFAGPVCAEKSDAPPGKQGAPGFTLVVTAALVGNLEPCGCSADQRGGVGRAAATVDAIRQEGRPVLLVDGGDRFFPGAALPADPLVANQQRLQAAAMAATTREMGYDALVLGARDATSATFLQGTPLPPLLDPGEPATAGTRPFLLRDVEGRQVGLFAVGPGPDAETTLAARAAALRAAGAQVLVLFAYRTIDGAKALLPAAKAAGVPFVVATRSDVPETQESGALADQTPALFAVAGRGEALLRIDVDPGGPADAPFAKVAGFSPREETLAAMQQRLDLLRADVKEMNPRDPLAKLKTDKLLELEERRSKLAASAPPPMPAGRNAFTFAFVPMSPKLAQAGAVKAIVEKFHQDAAKENLAYLRSHPRECPRATAGEPSFAGDQNCVDCHEEANDVWKKTPHAHAYQSLVDKGRQYDVACIGCHVMGYGKAGGACSIADVKGRENVQCESCHGAGSVHAEKGAHGDIAREVTTATCKTCHDPENSPHFNDKTYRPQVLGPGHGEPLAKGEAAGGKHKR